MKVAHLSAYLPYKVDFIPINEIGKNKPDYFELRSLDLPMEMVNFGYESVKAIDDIKLILRPLSDLVKEVYINRDMFCPVEVIALEYLRTVKWSSNEVYSGFFYNGQIVHPVIQENELADECPITIYRRLLEWHFDVFGLIEKGEAIDINTLK